MEFVEKQILPRYSHFDRAHSMQHVTNVIRNSITLAKKLGADVNMCYVIAAYHDLGLEGPRAIHHVTSGKILTSDARLKKWFSPSQLQIMKEAVEDHRASASHAPRSIYGKIVAEADRDLTPDTIIERTIAFGLDNYPEKTKQEHFERMCEHLKNKYSESGYIKLWINGSPNEQHLKELRNVIKDETKLKEKFLEKWELFQKKDENAN